MGRRVPGNRKPRNPPRAAVSLPVSDEAAPCFFGYVNLIGKSIYAIADIKSEKSSENFPKPPLVTIYTYKNKYLTIIAFFPIFIAAVISLWDYNLIECVTETAGS